MNQEEAVKKLRGDLRNLNELYEAAQVAIRNIEAWNKVMSVIESNLEDTRMCNKSLNMTTGGEMNFNIANSSGKIEGMLLCLDIIKTHLFYGVKLKEG